MLKLLLWTDNLLTRSRFEPPWRNAGAEILSRNDSSTPDMVVMDLTAGACFEHLKTLVAAFPHAEIYAFGPHADAELLQAARRAGAVRVLPRGRILDEVRERIAKGGRPGSLTR